MADTTEPEVVTLEEIKAVKGLMAAAKLCKRFDPPVDYTGLPHVTIVQEKLRLAWNKKYGKMKDINELGNMLKERRDSDQKHRDALIRFLIRLHACLFEMEEQMRRHVFYEYGATTPEEHITNFKEQMHSPANKLIVAGETSSGKSTLLNIFISEDKQKQMLPVKTLSCTATICELSYGSENKAMVIKGQEKTEIDFDKKDDYIYKPSEQDGVRDRFQHDAVHLELPAPFLKSGVILVDTPGIGESKEIGNVLKEYVAKTDVFGFLFTVASNRAGGMLPKFMNLLRDLSSDKYVDRYGQRKFNPGCVMFVANFWDKVKEEERDATKQNMFEQLHSLPFMGNFDPKKQVYFLNGDFAYKCKHEQIVPDDFADFIDGLSEFVLMEQKRKLNTTYKWLENCIQRVLHPVRTYRRRLKESGTLRKKNRDKTLKYLEEVESSFLSQYKDNMSLFSQKQDKAAKDLCEYLKSEEAMGAMTKWTSRDMPKELDLDDWILIEIGLDDAIDERLSNVLHNWEKEHHVISDAAQYIRRRVVSLFEKFGKELEYVEREIRSTSQRLELEIENNQLDESMSSTSTSQEDFKFPPLEELKIEDITFDIAFGKTFGNDIMSSVQLENAKENMQTGFSLSRLIFSKEKSTPKKTTSESTTNDVEKYFKDKPAYMRERAEVIFSHICRNEEFAMNVITQQLKSIEAYSQHSKELTHTLIASNKKLLKEIAEEKRSKVEVDKSFSPIEEQLVTLFDEVLTFGKSNILNPDFNEKDFKDLTDLNYTLSLFSGLCVVKLNKQGLEKSFNSDLYETVTLKKIRGIAAPCLHPSDKFFIEKNLRQSVKKDNVVKFLGTLHLHKERILVLQGHLRPARQRLLCTAGGGRGKRTTWMHVERNTMWNFLNSLASAVTFLHLRKLVHIELSMDTILIKSDDRGSSPLLSNLSEPTKVPISQNTSIAIQNYIHLPPEVLKQKSLYTQEGDIYGLGIIMLELGCLTDVFKELRESVSLGKWISSGYNSGAKLWKETEECLQACGLEITPKWKALALDCLQKHPLKRPSAKEFQEEVYCLTNPY